MKEKLLEIIRTQANATEAETPDELAVLYGRLRASIDKQTRLPDGSRDQKKYATWHQELSHAISAYEAEIAPVDFEALQRQGSADGLIRAVIQYGVLLGVIVAATDFLKPFLVERLGFDLMWLYFVVGAIVAFVAVSLLRRASFQSHASSLARVASVATLLSGLGGSIAVGSAIIPSANAKGVLAASVPALGSAQDTLLASLSNDVQDIKVAVGAAKKETSDDPRKELANMGIPYTAMGMGMTMESGDTASFLLFMEAGMRYDQGTVEYLLFNYDQAFADILLQYPQNMAPDVCRLSLYREEEGRNLQIKLCGAKFYRSPVEERLQAALAGRAIYDTERARKDSLLKECNERIVDEHKAALSSLAFGDFFKINDKAYDYAIAQSPSISLPNDGSEDRASNEDVKFYSSANLRDYMLAAENDPSITPTDRLHTAVANGCKFGNRHRLPAEVSDEYIQSIRDQLAKIPAA